ncbi:hypothetical protein SPRG_08189 [Saprolegnia parasitica CBS 223.65]|uniref:DUF7164 domain-containing protein n=1 Tax=Saprolegnia parasitica (strain CBS 223.65) TaxID=695850 RepID=A0A067CIL6_SAPPC|nr:hypothetical protein SPRG_08189 [Saprolegnia parasitica CBS 223.65]KDO26386.1 hypothetical protein SPRG_08189 [Saprolegnia parasitica CBS 223.65]|eukprot:XP_012202824.1 hypothetical protein SPRG_08189 [Saprolegnia parasitica CBS 223.65]
MTEAPAAVAPPRQLGLQLSLVILVFVVQFFVLQYWFASTPNDPQTLREEMLESVKATHEPFVRAAVLYLPSEKAFLPQLRWFHESWREMQKHEPSLWRTDMVVFTDSLLPELGALGCAEPNKCVVITSGFHAAPVPGYALGASVGVAGEAHPWVHVYDYLLRTDLDTFLTPAFASWKPHGLTVGFGEYAFEGYNTSARLARIATDLGYAPVHVTNVGSSWYGPRAKVQACARLAVQTMVYLHEREFSDVEKSAAYGEQGWPEWHHGAINLYASHLAINECTAADDMKGGSSYALVRQDMLDVPTTSQGSPFKHAHLRTPWRDDREAPTFSKFAFGRGEYDASHADQLSLSRIGDYALRMALRAGAANATTTTTDAIRVRAVVVFLPAPTSATLRMEFRTLHRSWLHIQTHEADAMRTDLLVYTTDNDDDGFLHGLGCTTAHTRSDPARSSACVRYGNVVPQRSSTFNVDMDHIHVLSLVPSVYDYILKVTPDAILAPGLHAWTPDSLVTASTIYALDSVDTSSRLERIATNLGLATGSKRNNNFGATWYGPAVVVRTCAALAMRVAKHLVTHEFTDEEKSDAYGSRGWPRWHFGVLELYASDIAIHDCAPNVVQRPDLLEAPATSHDAPSTHAVLRTHEHDGVFNKKAFAAGDYASASVSPDNIATNTSAYALFMALDAHKDALPSPTPSLTRVDDGTFVRAAVTYLPPKTPKFVRELRWFRRSWQAMAEHEPAGWRTDIVIYTKAMTAVLRSLNCSTAPRMNRHEPNKCIVITNYTPLRTKAFNYGYGDSLNVVAMDNAVMDAYDYMLRTDLDTFVTPAFATWKPKELIVGQGAYTFDGTTTSARLESIIQKLNYSASTIHNVGSTWYGPAHVVRRCAKLTVKTMLYLHESEFTAEEKSDAYGIKGWPNWHWGVLTLYAGHIAINHCANDVGVIKRDDMLDFPTTSSESPHQHAHLHTWQNSERFSKFSFAEGKYASEDMTKLRFNDVIADYAMYMALDAHKAPGLLPGGSAGKATDPPRDIDKSFVRAVVVHLPPLTLSLATEFQTFHRSWQYIVGRQPSQWRTDLIVYTASAPDFLSSLNCSADWHRNSSDSVDACIVVDGHKDLRSKAFPVDVDSFQALAATTNPLYEWLFKSTSDGILAPGFAAWKPATMVMSSAYYALASADTTERLETIAAKRNLSRSDLLEVGLTWYGPASLLRSCAATVVDVAAYMYEHEFTDEEKSPAYGSRGWPRWHIGVLANYAADIAINHCTMDAGIEGRPEMLEVASSESDAPSGHAHLHTWHNTELFNKNAFFAGDYKSVDASSLSIDTNTSAYALFIALEAQALSVAASTIDPASITSTMTRAAVVYMPSEIQGRFVRQLRWFLRSWQAMAEFEPAKWRTDILVFTDKHLPVYDELNCTSRVRSSPAEPNACIIMASYTSVKSDAFKYSFADSVNVVAVESPALDPYDYLLRTDIDTFLTPAFATWQPSKLIVGQGSYLGSTTSARLEEIAAELKWAKPTVGNIGSTWYGPAKTVRHCGKRAMEAMYYMHEHSFTDLEKSPEYGDQGWPRWHYGVLSMYGGELAINDCASDIGFEKRPDMLDFPTTSSESPFKHAHLHTWLDYDRFSKLAFEQGQYAGETTDGLLYLEHISDYAMYMALDAHKAPGLMPTPAP